MPTLKRFTAMQGHTPRDDAGQKVETLQEHQKDKC